MYNEDPTFDQVVTAIVGLTEAMEPREVGIMVATLAAAGSCIVDDGMKPVEKFAMMVNAIREANPTENVRKP